MGALDDAHGSHQRKFHARAWPEAIAMLEAAQGSRSDGLDNAIEHENAGLVGLKESHGTETQVAGGRGQLTPIATCDVTLS
jgi:hypothetical protein